MFQDLFASKCEDEQEISAANSATANKAYQTLVQPMARVKYLVRTPCEDCPSERAGYGGAPEAHKCRTLCSCSTV